MFEIIILGENTQLVVTSHPSHRLNSTNGAYLPMDARIPWDNLPIIFVLLHQKDEA